MEREGSIYTTGSGLGTSRLPSMGSFRQKLFFGSELRRASNPTPNPFPWWEGDPDARCLGWGILMHALEGSTESLRWSGLLVHPPYLHRN